jgi:hypothetical protein
MKYYISIIILVLSINCKCQEINTVDCQNKLIQILLLEGELIDKRNNVKIMSSDCLADNSILELSENGYLVLINQQGVYFEYSGKTRISLNDLIQKKKKLSQRINFGQLRSVTPIRSNRTGVIRHVDAPLHLLIYNPFSNQPILYKDSSDLCVQWFDELSSDNNAYSFRLMDFYGKTFYSLSLTKKSHSIPSEVFAGKKEFILEIAPSNPKLIPLQKSFLNNGKGRTLDCNALLSVENLLLGFYFEMHGIKDLASEFYEKASKDLKHPTYDKVYNLFLERNK